MTRTLNVRFLAILLVGLVVSAVGVHFLHAYQVRRNADAIRDQAEELLGWEDLFANYPAKVPVEQAEQVLLAKKKPDLVRASRLLSHYLALKPQDDKALVQYGLVLESSGNRDAVQTAFFVFEKVVRLKPDRYEIRRKLARMTLDAGHYQDALTHLNFLNDTFPNDPELEQMRGLAYERTGKEENFAKAEDDFTNAIKHAPHQIESYESLARLLRRHKKLTEADGYMAKLIDRNGKSERAYLARARYWMEFKSTTNAEEAKEAIKKADDDIATAYKLAPDNAEAILAYAESKLAYAERTRDKQGNPDQSSLDEAGRVLKHGQELHHQNAKMYQDLAAVELRANKREEAKRWLRCGLEHLPDQPELLWALANLLIDEGLDATDQLERMDKIGVLPAQLDYLRARVQVAKEEWSDAARILEQAQPDLAARVPELAKQANLLLAQCYGQLADWDQQYAAYRRALERDPFWLPACLGMGSTLTAMGKIDEALEIYRRIIPQYPRDPRAMLETVRLLIVKNLNSGQNEQRWGEINNLLEGAKERFPVEVILLRAETLIAQEQIDGAHYALQSKPGGQRKEVKPWIKARESLQKELDQRPKALNLRIALADLAQRQGEPKEALEFLDQAERQLNAGELQNTDRVNLLLARVQYWGRRGDDVLRAKQELTKLEKQALATVGPVESSPATTRAKVGSDDPTHPTPLRWKVLSALANAHLRLGDRWEAQRLLEQLAKERPTDLGVRLALFDIALEHGLEPDMPQLLQEIENIEGSEGTLWRYSQVRYLIWQAEMEQDNKDDAKEHLAEAAQSLNVIAARRPFWSRVPLAQAWIEDTRQKLQGTNNYGQTIQYYLQAIKAGERGQATIRRAFQLLCQNGQYGEANDILDKLPDQAILTGGFQYLAASILTETHQFQRGLSLAEGIVHDQRNEKDYRHHLWLAQLLSKDPQKKTKVEEELRLAKKLAPSAPEVWVAWIMHLARTDQKKEAEAAVNEAKTQIPADKAPLALAQCYEALGQVDQAGEQLKAALRAKPEDPAILRIVAAFYLRIRDSKNAQTILQKLIKRDPQSPDALWASRSLAIVLAAQGDSQGALEILDKQPDDTSEGLRARALVLMAQKEHRQKNAREAIANLEKIRPFPSSDDRFLLAQLYNTVGEWPKAREQMLLLSDVFHDSAPFLAYFVKSLIANHEAVAAGPFLDRLERIPNLAGTPELDEIKASFLAQTSSPAEAIKYLCQRASPHCPAEPVANACMKILHDSPATKQDLERVEEWLKPAMAREPKSATALTVCLADLRDLQGRYREAEDLYRQALEKDPRNVVALNNLAWLLVFEEGQGAEALNKINQAIEIAGRVPALLDTQGMAYLRNGNTEKAVKAFEQAMEDEPSAAFSFHLAVAQERKDRQAFELALTKAKSLGLKEQQLHALDRKVYQRLKQEYPALLAEGRVEARGFAEP